MAVRARIATLTLGLALAVAGCSSSGGPKPAAAGPTSVGTTTVGGASTTSTAAGSTGTSADATSSTSVDTTGTTAPPAATIETPATTTTLPVVTTVPVVVTPAAAVENLAVSDDLRAQLVAAGAALNGLSSSDYLGLEPGMTYYAYDSPTQTYWAAGALDPSPSSMQAQVSAQDDGGYLLFSEPNGGSWTAEDDGLGGVAGTPCPAIPASVVAVWGWPAGTCRPPG
jgi:hypothetical protein